MVDYRQVPEREPAIDRLTKPRNSAGWTIARYCFAVFAETLPRAGIAGEGKLQMAKVTLSEKLRAIADGMDSTIADKLRPSSQNWTPKRGREEASRRHEGRNLKDAQRALRLLADLHASGDCPPELLGVKTKKDVIELTRTRVGAGGGYYDHIDTGELSSKLPAAAILRSMLRSEMSPADRAAENERNRVAGIQQKIDALRGARIEGFFPTPSPIVAMMLGYADISPGQTVLEPSAGIGSIADSALSLGADVQCVEIRPSLCEILRLKGHKVEQADFTDFSGQFDRILMNPPFERGADCSHVRHAFSLLKPGGKLVALMADSSAFRNGFSDWLETVHSESWQLPAGSFNCIESFNRTGVNVRIVIIDKN